MASGRLVKQAAPYIASKYLNSNNIQDAVVGGLITAAPAGLNIGQVEQNIPGDRVLFNSADALALSNNNIGNLYCGAYRYVQFRNNATANPIRARAAYWDPTAGGLTGNNISSTAADMSYMVTTDGNAANYTNSLFAGVCIGNITLNNGTPAFSWIQESGKASVKMIAALTGTPAIGIGVYLPLTPSANANATDNGAFDVLAGANSAAIFAANSVTAYSTVDDMIGSYVGIAETLPSNNNISIVDLTWQRTSFRLG